MGTSRSFFEESSSQGLTFILPPKVTARIERRPEPLVRIHLATESESGEYRLGETPQPDHWWSWVQSLTHSIQSAGHFINGFDLKIQSTFPGVDFGFHSALITSTYKALRAAYELPITDIEIAQKSSVFRSGEPHPSIDLTAAALGRTGEVLLINGANYQFERVLVPMELLDLSLLKIDASVAGASSVPSGFVERAVRALRERDVAGFGTLLMESNSPLMKEQPHIRNLFDLAKAKPEIFGLRILDQVNCVVVISKPRTGPEVADSLIRAMRFQHPEIAIRTLWPQV